MSEKVNHPRHYTSHPSGVEAIDIVEPLTFNVGNAIKYVFRAGLKGDVAEDLRKALWYLRRELKRLGALGAFGAPCSRAATTAAARLLAHGDDGVLGDVVRTLVVSDYITVTQIMRAVHIVEAAIERALSETTSTARVAIEQGDADEIAAQRRAHGSLESQPGVGTGQVIPRPRASSCPACFNLPALPGETAPCRVCGGVNDRRAVGA